jgi:photosystem II stability/assembly factor-like uncharacterized protein
LLRPPVTVAPTSVLPEPSLPGRSTYADAVAFWDDERGLVGLNISRSDDSSSGALELTTDGGRSWATGGPTNSRVAQVDVVGSTDAWALTECEGASSCASRLYRSTDGGASWSSAVTDLTWVSFVDRLNGWGVVGSGPSVDPGIPALERTHDGGRHWATIESPCARSDVGSLRAVAFRSVTSGLAVCAFTAGAGGELHSVLATEDGGSHWTVRASTGDASGSKPLGDLSYGGYIRGTVETRDGTAWISGDRMVPLASHDGGARWQPLGLGDPDANLVYAAWPRDARHGVAVMWAPDSQATLFEITSDGGRTWTERSSWLVG